MNKKANRFEEYNPDWANWDDYIDRLKFCFEANDVIVDNVKSANFFTVWGSRVYVPRKATDVTYTEIEAILIRLLQPYSKWNNIKSMFNGSLAKAAQRVKYFLTASKNLKSGSFHD